jgi:hypothetical protein
MTKRTKNQPPISTDTIRLRTADAARQVPTRIEQASPDEAAQRYADVIAQVRERMQRDKNRAV